MMKSTHLILMFAASFSLASILPRNDHKSTAKSRFSPSNSVQLQANAVIRSQLQGASTFDGISLTDAKSPHLLKRNESPPEGSSARQSPLVQDFDFVGFQYGSTAFDNVFVPMISSHLVDHEEAWSFFVRRLLLKMTAKFFESTDLMPEEQLVEHELMLVEWDRMRKGTYSPEERRQLRDFVCDAIDETNAYLSRERTDDEWIRFELDRSYGLDQIQAFD